MWTVTLLTLLAAVAGRAELQERGETQTSTKLCLRTFQRQTEILERKHDSKVIVYISTQLL